MPLFNNLLIFLSYIQYIHTFLHPSTFAEAPLHLGAAWLMGAAWLYGCGVAQLVARRLAVRRARVRIPIRHPREVSATELFSDEEMETQITIMRIFADPDFFPFWISDPGFLIQQQQQMSKEK
jgi:hypothetical protein